MRILIPGGTGFLGSLLVSEWAAAGHDVVVLSRHPNRSRTAHPSVRLLEWDGRTAAGWGNEVDGADAIVNLAGESIGGVGTMQILFQRWTPEKKRRILDSRLNAGRAIVEAVRSARHKPKVLLQNGAIGYYGVKSSTELDESTGAGSDFLAGVVQAWETSTAPVESMGVRRVLLRTGLVLGTRGGTLPMMLLPFRFWAGGPLGNGRQLVPWVHEQDVAAAMTFLLMRPESSGVYNLVAPEIVDQPRLRSGRRPTDAASVLAARAGVRFAGSPGREGDPHPGRPAGRPSPAAPRGLSLRLRRPHLGPSATSWGEDDAPIALVHREDNGVRAIRVAGDGRRGVVLGRQPDLGLRTGLRQG